VQKLVEPDQQECAHLRVLLRAGAIEERGEAGVELEVPAHGAE
jgi:hypothetical protein